MPAKSKIFRVFLSELQTQRFKSVLAEAHVRTGISGVFATVRETFDLEGGRLGLELQIGRLSKPKTREIQRILSEDRQQDAGQPAPTLSCPLPSSP